MKQKHSLSGSIAAYPHVVWSVLFIVLPLAFVIYFAFTTPEGSFTFGNILALAEHKVTSRRPSGLRKTILLYNSLAHRTTWLRSDLPS